MPRENSVSEQSSAWRAIIAGLCASFLGIGLARFAYTPLIPVLIADHWFAANDAVALGAANLAGYLVGAVLARSLRARYATAETMHLAMLLTVASLLACAMPVSFAWFFFWRLISGITGGLLMVLAPTLVMARVPKQKRGFAAGALFTGIGLGMVASGRLVPALLPLGLTATWCIFGAMGLLVTILAWRLWPRASQPTQPADIVTAVAKARTSAPLAALYLAYGLNAVGIVPHMVFLVDFVARGLGWGLGAGGHQWVYVGLAAMIGPIVAGKLADHIGFGAALRISLVAQALAVGAIIVLPNFVTVTLSSVVIGASLAAIVPLALGRVHELIPSNERAQRAAWGLCTAGFALGQAAGGALFSTLFATSGSYALLFKIAFVALVLALLIDGTALLVGSSPNARLRQLRL